MKKSIKSEDKTRDLVARTILENGPQSAADLSEKLCLTAAGIRRHLDLLIEAGLPEAREPHRTTSSLRGRGRPSKVFVITDLGREKFEHSYDDLAVSALRFMSTATESGLVVGFAQSRANEIERVVGKAITGVATRTKKVQALAAFLTTEGYVAESKSGEHGIELCQHHCPIAHVASEFPELCEAETQAFSRLLWTHVQRLATIAHGDGICTTFIPTTTALNKTAVTNKQGVRT
ncbi:MAG TPA: metalloregulator ArsR/SmtB family transcription factor [Candidatus Nanopelagicaceae bacterium]